MHNDVVLEMWRQEENFVIKIEIFERSTRPPAAALIANRDTIPLEIVMCIKMRQAREHQLARCFFIFYVVFCHTTGAAARPNF